MIRKFNYTARKRISKSDAIITFDRSTSPLSFEVQLNLEKYNIEPEARVFVEAYRGNSFMRFDYGTVENLEIPSDRRLSEIEGADHARFRVKVVDGQSRKLFAITSALNPEQSSQDQSEPLLPLHLIDMGDQIWSLKFDDEGVRLQLDKHIKRVDEVRKTPVFQSLIFPAVVREILFYIIFIEKCEYQKDNDVDEESPWNKWLSFIEGFYREEYPGPYGDGDTDEQKFSEWIDGAVEAFCSKHDLKDIFQKSIHRGTWFG